MNNATKRLQKLVKERKTPVIKSERKKYNPYKRPTNNSLSDGNYYGS